MALPAITRHWCYTSNGVSSLNQVIVPWSYGYNYNNQVALLGLLLAFKKTLTGFAEGPWTVIQSRNARAVGSGGAWGNADYWLTADDFGALNSSGMSVAPWIVLRNTVGGTQTEIMFSVENTYNPTGRAYITTGGNLFPASVGGAQPVVPASALMWLHEGNGNATDFFYVGGAGRYRMHVMQSWDAVQGVESVRMSCMQAGGFRGWCFFDKLTNVPTGGATTWTNRLVAAWHGWTVNNYPSYSILGATDHAYRLRGIADDNTRIMPCMITECSRGLPLAHLDSGSEHNLSAGGRPMTPVSVMGVAAPLLGIIGTLPDTWIGGSQINSGAAYPSASSNPTHAQWIHVVWPWDPTAGAPQNT